LFAPVSTTTIMDYNTARSSSLLQKLRQLSDVRRNPPRFVFAEQLGCGAPSRLIFVIDVRERLPCAVLDDEASEVVFSGPRRREAASGH